MRVRIELKCEWTLVEVIYPCSICDRGSPSAWRNVSLARPGPARPMHIMALIFPSTFPAFGFFSRNNVNDLELSSTFIEKDFCFCCCPPPPPPPPSRQPIFLEAERKKTFPAFDLNRIQPDELSRITISSTCSQQIKLIYLNLHIWYPLLSSLKSLFSLHWIK